MATSEISLSFQDLEEVSDTHDTKHHILAGAMTGLLEYAIIYPIDFIKTRMQVLKPSPEAAYPSIKSAVLGVIQEGGVLRFFKGMPTPFIASIPSHAAYYVVYEQCKRTFSGTEDGYHSPLAQGAAGALAVMSQNLIQNPADVVKQRMQVYGATYKSSFACFQHVLRHEGIKAFYRSLPTQLAIDAPYGSIRFVVYEAGQNFLNPSRTFDAKSHVLSGAVAGGVAAAVTNPLDVCRTLINTQERAVLESSEHSFIRGLPGAAKIVFRTHGLGGFTRGLGPRVLFNVPKYSLCWMFYEFFKRFFSGK